MKMKKIIFALLILALIPATVLAWDDCPYGETNDTYPGDCGMYIDTDNDDICDLSQPVPEDRNDESLSIENGEEIHDLITGQELKTKTVGEIANIYQIDSNTYAKELSNNYKTNIKPADSFQLLYDNYGVEPSVAKDIAVSVSIGEQISTSESKDKNEKTYHLIPVLIVLSLIYFITLFLSKRKIISALTHKRIWNVFLLITFLVSGILGVLLVIRINFGSIISLPFNIMFWHVEAGIAMFVICVYHIIERWCFFKNMMKK